MATAHVRPLPTQLTNVAPGVYAFVQPDGGWCLNNAGLIVDGDDAIVIDTAATERRARRLRQAVEQVTRRPPRVVVNTHFHGDHTFGNFVFRPDAVIVSHEAARTEAAVADLGMRTLWPDVEWGDVELTLPNATYRDRMTLHVGDVRVELIHPGPAHTVTDTVVWVPDRSVLFVGDIVMSDVTPFCLMGSVSGSLRTIDWLRSLEPRTIVTGHGPVGGPELLDAAEAYLRFVARLAEDGLRRGRTPLEAAREASLGAFAAWRDPERLVGNLHRAYAERRGAPEGAPLNVLEIYREMEQLHGGPLPCHA